MQLKEMIKTCFTYTACKTGELNSATVWYIHWDVPKWTWAKPGQQNGRPIQVT